MDVNFDLFDEEVRREIARRSLHEFIQYINPEYITSHFSETVCNALDQFLLDMMDGKRPKLILGAPPQHGKSDIVSRYLPAYFFGKYPNMRVGALSYSSDLAGDMNTDVQRIMMSDEYRVLFPKTWLGNRPENGIAVKRNSDEFGLANHKGGYVCAGVGGPLTGKKVDLGIIDDPIKNSKEALSQTVKKSIWNWYVSTFKTRLSKNSGEIIMATRWATDDLSGQLKEKAPETKVLAFPAINEQGEALVPELHPIDKLLETKAIIGDYFWSAMYQQSPKPGDGQIFHEEFAQYYLPKDLPEKFDKVIHSWDMTFKDSDGTDYAVGQVWGKKDANAYLLYQIRKRMSFTETLKSVKWLAEKFPEGRRKLVEDKANGPAVIDSLKSTVSGLVPVEPDGSKVARAHACTAEWEAGNVWLPHKDIAPWIVETVEEITTFPFAGHDDTVDAMTQALRDLYQKKKVVSSQLGDDLCGGRLRGEKQNHSHRLNGQHSQLTYILRWRENGALMGLIYRNPQLQVLRWTALIVMCPHLKVSRFTVYQSHRLLGMHHKCLSATICARLSPNIGLWIKPAICPRVMRYAKATILIVITTMIALSVKSSVSVIKNTVLHIS